MNEKRKSNARDTALEVLLSVSAANAWSGGSLKRTIAKNGLDSRDAALASRIAYGVIQNRMYLDYYISLWCTQKAERLERARAALETVGLSDRVDHRPDQLSGGQCQRVAIARAIVGKPKLLLADEPTGALDSHTGREVLGMLQDLHGQGHTVVLITHDNSIAVQADRIIRLEDGQVVYDGDSRAPEAIVQPTLNFEPAEQEGNK